jgi:methionyl-tRNA formyltransferase
MRVFFIGSVNFSKYMLLSTLSVSEIEVCGVATKSKSKFNSDHFDLSGIASDNQIPVRYVKDVNAKHIIEWISELNPDVIYCFGWSSLIKAKLLSVAPLGVIGYHPTKLPSNRGRHPIIWALVLGLRETGSTFFKMDEGADSGDIISQEIVKISDKDTSKSLYDNLIQVASKQLPIFSLNLLNERVNWISQKGLAFNTWRLRGVNDGLIVFTNNSDTIYNLVRALTRPYIGAHIVYRGKEVKIWETEIGPNVSTNLEPGKVLEVDGTNILVKTNNGSIWLVNNEISVEVKVDDYLI